MIRKGLSNLFVWGILTCGICGFVFSSNGGIVTICVFLSWVFFMAAIGVRLKPDERYKDYIELGNDPGWYGSAAGRYGIRFPRR